TVFYRFVVGIEEQVKMVVQNGFALGAWPVDAMAVEVYGQRLGIGAVPAFFLHFHSVRLKPMYVFHPADFLALEPAPATENRMVPAQVDKLLDKTQKFVVHVRPVLPRNFVVLAEGVVVPVLGVPHFIARFQHRNALAEKKGGEKIPLLFL